jgi:hypothetical protein
MTTITNLVFTTNNPDQPWQEVDILDKWGPFSPPLPPNWLPAEANGDPNWLPAEANGDPNWRPLDGTLYPGLPETDFEKAHRLQYNALKPYLTAGNLVLRSDKGNYSYIWTNDADAEAFKFIPEWQSIIDQYTNAFNLTATITNTKTS